METPPILLHIVAADDWRHAQTTGIYAPDSLETEGFVHLSTPEQVLLPANRFYAGRRDLLILVLDTTKIEAKIRFEPADGQFFPHAFGPIPLDAVIDARPFAPDPDGVFRTISP